MTAHRYVYLGDALTDPLPTGMACDPVRRARDGKCIVGRSKQLVSFSDGRVAVVLRRRLRVTRTPADLTA